MTDTVKPEAVPEDVWAAAEDALDTLLCNDIRASGSSEQFRIDSIEPIARAILADRAARPDTGLLREAAEALRLVPKIASEAAEEWDKAPRGMRVGKIILALAGEVPGYRRDTDQIAATLKLLESSQ